MTHLSHRFQRFVPLAVAFSLGSMVMANAATADEPPQPCNLLTPDMLATTLEVSAEDVPQPNSLESMCMYQMETDAKSLEVMLMVGAPDTKKAAKAKFREATRDMTPEEITEKLKELGIERDESDKQFAKDLGLPNTQPSGVQFEEINGVGDEARFESTNGTLYILHNNLMLTLTAYYGSAMPIPDAVSFEALNDAETEWTESTMEKRRNQAVALAKTVVDAL